jgi:hypothetical protein
MSNRLVKGSGCGTREWREDFALVDTDGTVLFNLGTGGVLSLGAIETGLTAHAGGTQAAALALSASKMIHNVTIVGTDADSVKLPASVGLGAVHIVMNSDAAQDIQVFGSGTDTINAVATATGVAIGEGKSAIFVDYAAGKWFMILSA